MNIEKIKIGKGKVVMENPKFIGFAGFGDGDGFLMVFAAQGRKYAITLDGKIYPVVEKHAQLFIEIPYGGRAYHAPLQFKL